MAQIVSKLNLNKTPTVVEPNSLIFAKNIRLDVDGSIHRDYGVFPMSVHENDAHKLINYKNIINRIIADVNKSIVDNNYSNSYMNIIHDRLKCVSGKVKIDTINNKILIKDGKYKIVGIIANSNEFYMFINGTYKKLYIDPTTNAESYNEETCDFIICYDEKKDKFYPCNCNWSWSGGTIDGCIINNLRGEKIINIGETNATSLVPLKCINLSTSSIYDNERIYTQTPNIPITNLNFISFFNYIIPNGVYQFFVRYKIRDNFYTDWFPASKELFIGNNNIENTSFGTVKYVNTHRDSDSSFTLDVKHLFKNVAKESKYESFQVGFILSHDDAIVARAWKHFNFDVTTINFDYNAKDAYEIEVTDLLKNAYQLYDVGNIVSFKNKLYISNYKETDFNEDYQSLANDVAIDIIDEPATDGYSGYRCEHRTINGAEVIAGLIIDDNNKAFSGQNGIIDALLNTSNNGNTISVKEAINDALTNNYHSNINCGSKLYDIQISGSQTSLETAKKDFLALYDDGYNTEFSFKTEIDSVRINGDYIKFDFSDYNPEDLLNLILSTIYNKERFLTKQCTFINNKGNEDYKVTIEILRTCQYKHKYKQPSGGSSIVPDVEYDDSNKGDLIRPNKVKSRASNDSWIIDDRETPYIQTITFELSADVTKYHDSDSSFLTNYTTLIPYQKYKFYIHYVKQNGEISNGYFCNGANAGIKEVPFKSSVNSIIYPVFKNIKLPKGYVACFFSIIHIENIVATVFNIKPNDINVESSCIDINAGLLGGSDNIIIKQGINDNTVKTTKGKYYYSSDSSNVKYFGADGVITFNKDSGITGGGDLGKGNNVAYIVNKYTLSETDDIQLVKCTPFIDPKTLSKDSNNINFYDSYSNMNLLGFICVINPLDRARTEEYYTDGASVFLKKDRGNTGTNGNYWFELLELRKYLNDAANEKEKLTSLEIINTNSKYVYSNYNLNYLGLNEDPVEVYKSYYNGTSDQVTKNAQPAGSMVLKLFKSLIMSTTYMLPSMYKTYTRKTYSAYNPNEVTKFDNTVRSSELVGDEEYINIFKFEPNDYYNIPTNRGLIVNLVSVGDVILVHTEDSIFKFSGSNTLQSSNGDVQTTENNVFNTGVSEVFGSDFGFAGLQYKDDHIMTENGYIFFDRDSRVIYMYSGQGQIVKISDSIEKLFRYKNIESVRFANDYYNNRFFISILFYEDNITIENEVEIIKRKYYPVTLSFNISEQIKAFVSLHDFYYSYAFNTKTKCYFLADTSDICTISKKYKGCYTKLELSSDNLYIQKKDSISIDLYNGDTPILIPQKYDINSYYSIVDIINNMNYEDVKTLNAISWCGTKIESEFSNIDLNDEKTLNMVEEVNDSIPCKYLRIYSDTCMTPLCDCTKRSNDKSPNILEYNQYPFYKYPFYNQGVWNFNYFRNILNSKDNKTRYSGDNNSLIEGKYFVVRFVFDSDFKLETLSLNYNIK